MSKRADSHSYIGFVSIPDPVNWERFLWHSSMVLEVVLSWRFAMADVRFLYEFSVHPSYITLFPNLRILDFESDIDAHMAFAPLFMSGKLVEVLLYADIDDADLILQLLLKRARSLRKLEFHHSWLGSVALSSIVEKGFASMQCPTSYYESNISLSAFAFNALSTLPNSTNLDCAHPAFSRSSLLLLSQGWKSCWSGVLALRG